MEVVGDEIRLICGNFWSISSNRGPTYFGGAGAPTVQRSQRTLLWFTRRFSAAMLAHVTPQAHLHLKMEAQVGLQQFVALTVNFGQTKSNPGMLSLHKTLAYGAYIARIALQLGVPGCKSDCTQRMR